MKTDSYLVRALVLAAVLSGLGRPAEAQRAFKVKEINPTVNAASGFPNEFVEVGGVVVFAATDASDDRELWVTDATTEGTRRLKDINPGVASSEPLGLTLMNGVVYFQAKTTNEGTELWRTDGTEAGTRLVKDVIAGVGSGSPSDLAAVGDTLFFSAYDPTYGRELWVSDGTAAGTVMVADLVAGTGSSSPTSLRGINGVLYFAASTSATGSELWRSDGTAGGTFMIRDIYAGTGSSNPTPLGSLNDLVFFSAYTSSTGKELWATDGTTAGTYQVIDLVPGSQGGLNYGGSAATYNGYFYFQAQQASSAVDGLWRTDGTAGGTTRLTYLQYSGDLTLFGGSLYFVGTSGSSSQLWRCDGTAAGTFAISSVPNNGVESSAYGLIPVGNTIFFFGNDQLWASDGTPGNAHLVKDILPGTTNYSNMHLQGRGLGRLFFSATDLVNGQEPWVSDGTTAGTNMLKDVRTSPNSGSPSGFVELNGGVVFAANDGLTGLELWKSNGTGAGTALVKDLVVGAAGASPSKLTRSGNYVYFVGNVTTTSSALWRTDGTSAGTFVVGSFQGTSTTAVPDKLTDVNGTLYFVAASSSSSGVELFKSTGSSVTLVKDLRSFYGSSPDFLTPLGSDLYFGATDNVGYKLFKTDGTAAGTVEATQGMVPFSGASRLANAGSRLFFSAQDATHGFELWTTDGTSAGTYMVADINPTGASSPAGITMVDGMAYFTANDGVSGVELWRSDGTAAGTVQVADLNPGPASSSPASLKGAGGLLYFAATNGVTPVTLWSTDGTPGGTVQIRDAATAAPLSAPASMADANGTLLFQANEGATGAELWSTDGASGFAFQIQDINPGPSSSAPSSITFSGGRAYFAANDGVNGVELWSLANQAPLANAGLDQTVNEGTAVALSAGASTDPDQDTLTYEWRDAAGVLVGRGADIAPTVPPGEHAVTLIARDGYGGMATDSTTITVRANVELVLEASGQRGGSGGIQADANEICGNAPGGSLTCTYTYVAESTAHLVASPSADSVFAGWTGACAASGTSPTCDVAMSGAATVGASFLGPHILTVNVTSVENGLGTVGGATSGGASLQCDAVSGAVTTCTMRVREGDTVLVGAIPGAQSILASITGCGAGPIDPNGSGCPPFTMSGAQSIDVSLRGPQTLTVQSTSFENGTGTIYAFAGTVMALQCDTVAGTTATCTVPVRVGDVMELSMAPGALSIVTSVTGCDAEPLHPEGPACAPFAMTGPRTITATFRGPQTLTVHGVSLENGIGAVYGNTSSTGAIQCEVVAGATSTCTTQVRVGDPVSLNAVPGTLSILSSVTGCEALPLDPNGSGCTPFTLTGPTTVDVTFRGPRTLTLHVESLGGGVGVLAAESTPFEFGALSTCSGAAGSTVTCTGQFRHGSTVLVTTGGSGTDWVQDLTGCNWDPASAYPSCTIDLSEDRTVTASFLAPQTLSVHVASVESGYGGMIIATEFAGVRTHLPDCASVNNTISTCTVDVHARETVFLMGSDAASPSVIESLSGCVIAPIVDPSRSCVPFTMTGPKAVTLTLRGPQNLNVSLVGDGSGTVAWAGGPLLACQTGQGPCVYPARIGTPQVLSATPAPDSLFQVWTGACAGQGAVCTVTLTDDVSTEAVFVLRNHAPVASAGGPYSGVRNTVIAFSGAGSSDPDNDPLTYSWDFGDGSAPVSGVSPTHAYATTGSFTATLIVNDGSVNSAAATSTVTISNQAPIANAGGPYAGVRNQTLVFNGAASSDPDNDGLTYAWTFGDGGTGTGASPSHAYTATGTFTATLTVNDGTTTSAPATSTVTISNRVPAANPGGPYAGTRLAAIALSGASSTDPDGDPLTYSWTFGDGAVATGPTPTHLYTSVGTFTVTLTVNDGITNSAPATTTVQITNVAPVVSLTGPASGSLFNAPANVTLSAAANDPDGAVAKVEFFSGAVKIGQALSEPYLILWSGVSPGIYSLTAVVTDSSGAAITSTPVAITVNALPAVALTAPANNAQFAAPAAITLTANASDPDGSIAQVQFFSGSASLGIDTTSPYSVVWTGAAAGAYTLTAVATDNLGAVVSSTPITVKVTAALAPLADSYVRASNGNSNFGTATTITVQQGSSNSNIRWTYMKFDLSSVPTITNAKVRVFGGVSATTSATVQTAVYPASNTTWTETGLTWNNKPASGTTALSSVTIVNSSTSARWYELDVTAYLQAEKAAGRNVVTLVLKNLANTTPFVTFSSRENGTVANRPHVLVVP